MKVNIISDVHADCFPNPQSVMSWSETLAPADVLVIAGDLALDKDYRKPFVRGLLEDFEHVIFVAGNHDFWGDNIASTIRSWRKVEYKMPNFHFLNNQEVVVHGQRFVGSTLWWKGTFLDETTMAEVLNDYRRIPGYSKYHRKKCQEALEYLEKTVQSDDVVITHNCPFEKLHPCPVDGSYSGYLDRVSWKSYITNAWPRCTPPKLWAYGHTHEHLDLTIDGTRFVTNGLGYHHYRKPGSFGVGCVGKIVEV